MPVSEMKYRASAVVSPRRNAPETAAAMSTYARALTQRNTLLRRIREEQAGRDQLPFWDETIVREGGTIVRRRLATLEALAGPVRDRLAGFLA